MDNINDHTLDEYASDVAIDIMKDIADNSKLDANDLAWEHADSSSFVIYYSQAHELCRNCNTDNGEEWARDMGGDTSDYNLLASYIAFGELYHRICQALIEKRFDASPNRSMAR